MNLLEQINRRYRDEHTQAGIDVLNGLAADVQSSGIDIYIITVCFDDLVSDVKCSFLSQSSAMKHMSQIQIRLTDRKNRLAARYSDRDYYLDTNCHRLELGYNDDSGAMTICERYDLHKSTAK